MTDENKGLEMAGTQEITVYGKYFQENFSPSGNPKGYELEKYMANAQDNIDEIVSLAKYYYRKDGLIMRTINIIRDFGLTELKLEYDKGRARTESIINEFNERIDVDQLIKDILFEMALTGNCALYDRDGQYIEIFPLSYIDVSSLKKNGNPLLYFENTDMGSFSLDESDKEAEKNAQNAYPEEVRKGLAKGESKILLDDTKTYFLKSNCSRYEKYGVTFLLPAFNELAQKNLLKQAEKSTASGIIDQILHIKVGDKDNPPTSKMIEFYSRMFSGKQGAVRVTTPYFVSAEWVTPETEVFGEEKFKEIDKDLLSSLGVSLTLLRGEGGGNYSEGFISLSGLIKTIESLRQGIPRVLEDLYRKELVRNGINADKAPKVSMGEVVIDRAARLELTQWLFQNAGLPYEIMFEEHGYDYDSIKLIKKEENKEKVNEVFTLPAQPFQGTDEGGRPKENLEDRKSDKSQSNNDQPRTGNNYEQ